MKRSNENRFFLSSNRIGPCCKNQTAVSQSLEQSNSSRDFKSKREKTEKLGTRGRGGREGLKSEIEHLRTWGLGDALTHISEMVEH